MTYPPPHHQDDNKDHLREVIRQYPLATMITVSNETPFVTHLPLILHDENILVGHIDKYNPQAAHITAGHRVELVFYGPQCYISPVVYVTEELPTWNYIRVHLSGYIEPIDDPEVVKDSLIAMTAFLESPDHRYVLEPDNPKLHRALPYIKGFKVHIDRWEGKLKLSQDKSSENQERANTALIKANQNNISAFLDRIR